MLSYLCSNNLYHLAHLRTCALGKTTCFARHNINTILLLFVISSSCSRSHLGVAFFFIYVDVFPLRRYDNFAWTKEHLVFYFAKTGVRGRNLNFGVPDIPLVFQSIISHCFILNRRLRPKDWDLGFAFYRLIQLFRLNASRNLTNSARISISYIFIDNDTKYNTFSLKPNQIFFVTFLFFCLLFLLCND